MSIRVQRSQSESRYKDAEMTTEGSFRKDSDTQTALLPKLTNKSNQNNFPNIKPEYLRGNDKKSRFYTGFISFAMFWHYFQTTMKHEADKLH